MAEAINNVILISDSDHEDEVIKEIKSKPELIDCPVCLQTCIHPARLPCGHIFCFLCVKGVANKNRRCAMCRREIPTEFLNHPQLVHGIDDLQSSSTTEDGYQWFYEGRNGWWQYDERTSQDIEEAYKRGDKTCTILVAGYLYTVDYETMVQLRQNDLARRRRVKRDLATIPKKGVAGLRIDSNNVVVNDHNDIIITSTMSSPQTNDNLNIINTIAQIPNDNVDNQQHQQQHNNFISTITATDAAIRIASDIIDSTLAHADDDEDDDDMNGENTRPPQSLTNIIDNNLILINNSNNTLINLNNTADILLNNAELILPTNITMNPDLPTNTDFFLQTLENGFRTFAINNLVTSSDDSDDDNEQIIL